MEVQNNKNLGDYKMSARIIVAELVSLGYDICEAFSLVFKGRMLFELAKLTGAVWTHYDFVTVILS